MKGTSLVVCISLFSMIALAHDAAIIADEQTTIAGWGTVTDPDKDCFFSIQGDKLGITVPAKNHNLHPARGLNAPRVLKRVSGDFSVQVKITADFRPGATSTAHGQPFNGSGLLIWQNEESFLRVERNAYWVNDALLCYPPLIEYWSKGAYRGASAYPTDAAYFKGSSTWLKARRQGKDVTVSISHDGQEWSDVKTFPVEMADDLFVGVAAVNSSDTPFSVQFEGFTVIGMQTP